MHPFLKVLILTQEVYKSNKKKNCAEQQNPPRSSLRARSLTAPPHPTLPPIPAARNLARRIDRPSLSPSLPFPSLPPPIPPPSTYLPIYLPPSTYLPIYLSIYLPTPLPIYLPASRLPPSPCPPAGPPPGRCTNSRFPYPSQGLFSSLSSLQALPDPSRDFFLFFPFLC